MIRSASSMSRACGFDRPGCHQPPARTPQGSGAARVDPRPREHGVRACATAREPFCGIKASPPLSPLPASTTTRAPYTRPSRRAQVAARPAAARCMSAPSGRRAISACSAARTFATSCACLIARAPSPRRIPAIRFVPQILTLAWRPALSRHRRPRHAPRRPRSLSVNRSRPRPGAGRRRLEPPGATFALPMPAIMFPACHGQANVVRGGHLPTLAAPGDVRFAANAATWQR